MEEDMTDDMVRTAVHMGAENARRFLWSQHVADESSDLSSLE